MVASATKAEVWGLSHNGQTAVSLLITLDERGFTQPPTPIKTYNSAAEGIVTVTVRQKRSKATDMKFYWMKERVKQKDFFCLLETRKLKHGGSLHETLPTTPEYINSCYLFVYGKFPI